MANIIWAVTGGILTGIIFLAGWMIIRALKKRAKFTTMHGIKVFTHLNEESNYTTKQIIDSYMEAYIQTLAAEKLFSANKLYKIVRGTSLYWRIFPYWNEAKKRFDTGTRSNDIIAVGWQPKLERTALAHEYMHLFLDKTQGDPDANHRLKSYWSIADGFLGVIG